MAKKKDDNNKLIAENRRARYDYAIEDTLECGMVLHGSEVKSLREGGANIAESYVDFEGSEIFVINSYIPTLSYARTFGHEERRHRKLLANKKEIAKLWAAKARNGMTIVPLKMYFNEAGRVKLLIGTAKGKKMADKRDTEKKRDWQRQKARLLREG